MFKIIRKWFHRYFSDPEAVLLFVLLVLGFGIIIFMGNILAPVFASIIIAYFLQWWVSWLQKHKVPHLVAYPMVYISFLGVFTVGVLVLFPLLCKQLSNLFNELPVMLQNAKLMALGVIDKHPYFSVQQVNSLTAIVMQDIQNWGRMVVSVSLSSIPGVIAWFVYLILVHC